VWHGAFLEASGYADEARSYLLALEQTGRCAIARESRSSELDAGATDSQLGVVERAKARRLPDAAFTLVHHLVPRAGQPLHGAGPDVARTMFETDRIPASFLPRLLEVDEVWVPCTFNHDTFRRGGVPAERLHVLPETIDFDLFSPGADPLPVEGRRGFTFLTNFDFTDRKGWDVLLDAWAAAFDPDDDVCLLLKCVSLHGLTGEGIRERIERHLRGRRTAPIVINTELLPVADLPRLYAAADAFVLASRGEGWGRPYMEAMAMGLPTIGSRWSGNLDFMDDDNAWLVDGHVVDVDDAAQQHTTLYRGHRWFEADRDALAAALRKVAAGDDEVTARAESARAGLVARFGPEPVAARLEELTVGALERWNDRRTRPIACVWRGEFGAAHSLAIVNDACVRALEQGGAAVRLTAPGAAPVGTTDVGVAQQWPPSFDPPAGGPFVLYQPWEFGRIPAAWVDGIRRTVDEVWTPSAAARSAFVESGVAPDLVHVVPNAVDLDLFGPNGPALELAERRGTVFLFVGGALHRKGIDLLLDAYGRAFTAADDVLLLLKVSGLHTVYRGSDAARSVEAFRARSGAPAIALLDDDLPFERLPEVYRAADVVVQPYRGEGFCLPALEALASGRPVIVTAGGPTDDFVTDACGWRIPSQRTPLPAGSLPEAFALAGEGFLLEPDRTALAEALVAAADPAARAAKAAAARARAESYSWASVAGIVSARLDALRDATPIRRIAPAVVPGRKKLLLAVLPDWRDRESWAAPLAAYARAFTTSDDTTLVLPAADEAQAVSLLTAELAGLGADTELPDVALAAADPVELEALELAADAVIAAAPGRVPRRARRVVPADPAALRALLQEAA
jgi:glycosyltransferase involved in cell wall biosynthesis